MNYDALRESIEEVLAQTRQNHVNNLGVPFRVIYYSVKENGECEQSPSSSIFKDMKWGMISISYCPGNDYKGWPYEKLDRYFVSNDGLISTCLVFDDLKLTDTRIRSNNGTPLYSAKSRKPEEFMPELDKVLPIIHGCRTEEEANMLIEIDKKNAMDEKDTRSDMVEMLMKEISRLKEVVSDYEKKIEEIRSILFRDEG